MFLLVWLKTLSTQYSSPSIAYTCGQTYPWNYAGSTSSEDAAKLLQCNIQPAECTDEVRLETVLLVYRSLRCCFPQSTNTHALIQNYYMTEIGPFFYNYGYLASAWGATYSQYAVQIGDDSPVYSQTPISYSSDGAILTSPEATGPSPSFVKLMSRISSGNKAAGPDSSKVAVVGADSGDANLPDEVDNLFNYLTNMLDNAEQGISSNLMKFSSESELESYVTDDDYDDPSKFSEKISFAIVLNKVDDDNHQYDYTIRTNYTYPWEQR